MNFRRSLMAVALLIFIMGCGSQSRVVTTKKEQENQQKDVKIVYVDKDENSKVKPENEVSVSTPPVKANYGDAVLKYIDLYKSMAKYEMKEHGIPASITLAQGILESAAGTSEVAVRANNHFGIKCNREWLGEEYQRDEDCFRKYDNPRASFQDHSFFLQRPHYRSLFSLPKDDYKSWAAGLKRAGYATDGKYPEKLINIIDRYQLYKYDQEVLKAQKQETVVVETSPEPKINSSSSVSSSDDVVKYIELYKAVAKHEMKTHGIPASITLAQAILESGAGGSEVAVRANNHFGIKCTDDWQGARYFRDEECFRRYDNARASFQDHSLFLQRPRYQFLFTLPKDDYKGWAAELHRLGYATDRDYPGKLINIIDRYELHKLDKEVLKDEKQEAATVKTASGTEANSSSSTGSGDVVVKYIEQYKSVAKYEMEKHGIPASITLAQAILESAAGGSEVTVRANNHFGIKCNEEWNGARYFRDEQCFRRYNNARASFEDHSLFLQRSHYRPLFSLAKDDYKGWAEGLQQAGYATDRNYPEKLVNIIERYQLYKYDREVLGTKQQGASVKAETPPAAKQDRYKVKQGDTLYSIARKHGLSVQELMKMNGLTGTRISVGQVLKVTKR